MVRVQTPRVDSRGVKYIIPKTKALQLKRAYAADEEEIVKIKDRICGVNGGLDVPLSSGRKLRIIFEIVE